MPSSGAHHPPVVTSTPRSPGRDRSNGMHSVDELAAGSDGVLPDRLPAHRAGAGGRHADWHRANLRLGPSESLALLAGPAAAGAVIAARSLPSALGLDVATYVLSVVVLSLLLRGHRRSRATSRPTAEKPERTGALTRTGFRYVRAGPVPNLAGVVAELVGLRGVILIIGAIATTCPFPLFRRAIRGAP